MGFYLYLPLIFQKYRDFTYICLWISKNIGILPLFAFDPRFWQFWESSWLMLENLGSFFRSDWNERYVQKIRFSNCIRASLGDTSNPSKNLHLGLQRSMARNLKFLGPKNRLFWECSARLQYFSKIFLSGFHKSY